MRRGEQGLLGDGAGGRQTHVQRPGPIARAHDVHRERVAVQGGHRPDEHVHAAGAVGDVDEDPPVAAGLVLGAQEHLRGGHGGADARDQGVPVQLARLPGDHRVEHGQADGQGQGEVREGVVVDVVVDPAGHPDALDDGAHVVPARLHPRGLDLAELAVAMGPGEGLELEEVPAALGVGEDRGTGGHDGGQGRQLVGGLHGARDPVACVRGDLLGHDRGEQLGAPTRQLADAVLGDPDLLGDLAHADALVAVLGEELRGHVDDPPADLLVGRHRDDASSGQVRVSVGSGDGGSVAPLPGGPRGGSAAWTVARSPDGSPCRRRPGAR